MFYEHQICLSEWFLKDHVTQKTWVIAAENSAFHHRNKLHFKVYCNHIYKNNTKQINAALVSIYRLNVLDFQKHKTLLHQTFEWVCVNIFTFMYLGDTFI